MGVTQTPSAHNPRRLVEFESGKVPAVDSEEVSARIGRIVGR
jgi:hypothetical protein